MQKKVVAFFFVFFIFKVNFLFSQQLNNIQKTEKKFIFSEKEYEDFVREIYETKMQRFQKLYPTTFEVYYDLPERRETVKVSLFSPPFKVSQTLKNRIDTFKKRNKTFFSSKFFYIYLLKEDFFYTPMPITYYGQLTCDAESVYNLRIGNCFSLTNLFIALTRNSGMESFYYLAPEISSDYLSGETLVSTTHIICGIEVGAQSPYLVDFYPPSNVDYLKMLKSDKLVKLTDIEAGGLFFNNLGCKFYLEKDYGFAEYLLTFASCLYPKSPLIANNLGVVYKREGYFDRAIEEFLKALNLGGRMQKIVANILQTEKYLPAEKRKEIESLLENRLENNYYWHLLKAEEYMKAKDFDMALKEIKKADSLFPENQQVYSYYIRYALKVNDRKMLEKYLKKVQYFNSAK